MTDKPAIHLKDIIDTRLEQPPIWVAYPGSETFQVLVRPLGSRQQEFISKAQRVDWDLGYMARKVVVDQEQYLKLFCDWVIVDWAGLTVEDLRMLVLIDEPKKWRGAQGEIGCDEDAKLLLMEHSPVFNKWINQVTRDIERFNLEREGEAEKKPLRQSGSGSTTPESTAASVQTILKKTVSSQNAQTVQSNHGTQKLGLFWPFMIWPAPGVILNMSGLRQHLMILISQFMSGQNSEEWYWPCIAA